MAIDESAYLERYRQKVEELRAQMTKTLEELEKYAPSGSSKPLEPSSPPGTTSDVTVELTGQPIIAGQGNYTDHTTFLITSPSGDGLYVFSQAGQGVRANSFVDSAVVAFSRDRQGVLAQSVDGDGVRASTSSNGAAALFAENDSIYPGGVAVVGLGQAGIGVYASGAQAALQLGRAELSGAPTSGFHVAGELVLDANSDLYLCKVTGSPGTWKLIG